MAVCRDLSGLQCPGTVPTRESPPPPRTSLLLCDALLSMVWYMMNLNDSAVRWLWGLAFIFLQTNASISIGYLVSCLSPDVSSTARAQHSISQPGGCHRIRVWPQSTGGHTRPELFSTRRQVGFRQDLAVSFLSFPEVVRQTPINVTDSLVKEEKEAVNK